MGWLGEAVRTLLGWLPEWAREKMGLVAAAAAPAAPSRPAPESLLADARTQVGGDVRIHIEGAPPGTRIDRVRTDNPDVPIDVSLGYAMAGT